MNKLIIFNLVFVTLQKIKTQIKMRHIFLYSLTILSLFLYKNTNAQSSHKDSIINIPTIAIQYAYQIPAGNIKEFYGNNSKIGIEFNMKFKNNFILGASSGFLFGENIKNKESYFRSIQNSNGYITDANGQFAEVFLYERGFNIELITGYIFNKLNNNPNSGPFIHVGLGYLSYWTRAENPGLTVIHIQDEYKYIYDRMRHGFSSSQLIGYKHYGNKNLGNFYVGLEFTQAWTDNGRFFNIDLNKSQLGAKLDLFYSIKIAWMVPLYKKAPKEFYYY